MIIEMIQGNKKNPDEVLKYLQSIDVLELNKNFKINTAASINYLPFWQLFIERTEKIDSYIVKKVPFETMQKEMKKNYGYIIPNNLKQKYINTVPIQASNSTFDPSKDSYSGAWLHNNAISLTLSLYSVALFSENEKAKAFLEENNSEELGFYLMPSGVKILIDPKFLHIN